MPALPRNVINRTHTITAEVNPREGRGRRAALFRRERGRLQLLHAGRQTALCPERYFAGAAARRVNGARTGGRHSLRFEFEVIGKPDIKAERVRRAAASSISTGRP